jgi:transposase
LTWGLKFGIIILRKYVISGGIYMAHPDWVLKHKKKGVEIRLIKGKYYLYEVKSKWNKEKGRPQKITGKYLGRIIETGLVVPKIKQKEEKAAKVVKSSISVKEYGASSFMMKQAEPIQKKLTEIFEEDGGKILAIAMLRAINQCPFKRIEHLYEHSYISEVFPDLRLSGKELTSFLRNIGNKRDKIVEFMNSFVEGSRHIIFDATSVISQSKQMGINRSGYNSKRNFDPQVNLLYAFSYDCDAPVYYRIIPGNVREVSAFKLSVNEAGLKDAVVVADKGFSSQTNIQMLETELLNYVIPLKRDSKYFDDTPIKAGDKSKFEGHFMFNKRPVWYYSREVDAKKKAFVFIDSDLKTEEEKDYLQRIENNLEGYTMENFLARQYAFGTIIILTNLDKSAKEVYEILKSRNNIEVAFDTLKNLLNCDSSYMHNEEALEAWAFINHISMMLLYKIYSILKKNNMLSRFSVADILEHLRYIFRLRVKNEWKLSEISSKTKKIMESINCPIT